MAQAVARLGASRAVISEMLFLAKPGIDSPAAYISAWRRKAAWMVGLLSSGNAMFIRVL